MKDNDKDFKPQAGVSGPSWLTLRSPVGKISHFLKILYQGGGGYTHFINDDEKISNKPFTECASDDTFIIDPVSIAVFSRTATMENGEIQWEETECQNNPHFIGNATITNNVVTVNGEIWSKHDLVSYIYNHAAYITSIHIKDHRYDIRICNV